MPYPPASLSYTMLICLNDLFACLGLAQTRKLLTNFSKNSFYLLSEPLRLGYFLTNYCNNASYNYFFRYPNINLRYYSSSKHKIVHINTNLVYHINKIFPLILPHEKIHNPLFYEVKTNTIIKYHLLCLQQHKKLHRPVWRMASYYR